MAALILQEDAQRKRNKLVHDFKPAAPGRSPGSAGAQFQGGPRHRGWEEILFAFQLRNR